MQDLNAKLLARAQEVEQKHGLIVEQFAQMNACLKQKSRENERLQSELERLKSTITVRHFDPCQSAFVLQGQTGVGPAVGEWPKAPASPWRPCLHESICRWRSACACSELIEAGPAGAGGRSAQEGWPARCQPRRQCVPRRAAAAAAAAAAAGGGAARNAQHHGHKR